MFIYSDRIEIISILVYGLLVHKFSTSSKINTNRSVRMSKGIFSSCQGPLETDSTTHSKHISCMFYISSQGVADGVGGWRDYGVDPSQFSATLMRTCERLVKEGRFVPSQPVGILTSGYYELLQYKVPLLGEHVLHLAAALPEGLPSGLDQLVE